MQNILVANGVNLDLLGQRDPHHYGSFTLQDLEKELSQVAPQLAKSLGVNPPSLSFFQSNDESKLMSELDKGWDGILLNAGAWTHTSLAIADRLSALGTPFCEVHISNVHAREKFRRHSFLAPISLGTISGFGLDSYVLGLVSLLRSAQKKP